MSRAAAPRDDTDPHAWPDPWPEWPAALAALNPPPPIDPTDDPPF